MDTQRRWIGYDTFKLIIALILLVLLLVLAFQKPPVAQVTTPGQQVGAVAATETPLAPTNTVVMPTASLPPSSTPTSAPPTATQAPTATATTPPQPTPTATPAPTEPAATPTTAPAATPEPTATPAAQPQTTTADCPLAQPSRLSVGQQASVMANLNLRSAAGMDQQITRVGLINTKVEIIGGPVCTPYQGGAYLWWNIKYPDGVTGWSAEGSLNRDFYFLQPIQ